MPNLIDIPKAEWDKAKEYFARNKQAKLKGYDNALLRSTFNAPSHSFINTENQIFALAKNHVLKISKKHVVKLAQDEQGNNFCCFIAKSENQNEISILKRLAVYAGSAIINKKTSTQHYFFTVHTPGVNLEDYFKLSDSVTNKERPQNNHIYRKNVAIALGCAIAIKKAHDLKIAHRNISPQNFVVSFANDELKVSLINYSEAKVIEQENEDGPAKFRVSKESWYSQYPAVINKIYAENPIKSDLYEFGKILKQNFEIDLPELVTLQALDQTKRPNIDEVVLALYKHCKTLGNLAILPEKPIMPDIELNIPSPTRRQSLRSLLAPKKPEDEFEHIKLIDNDPKGEHLLMRYPTFGSLEPILPQNSQLLDPQLKEAMQNLERLKLS